MPSKNIAPRDNAEKKSIINFIEVSFHGGLFVNPIDILRSKEGYNSFKNDRKYKNKKHSLKE